MNAFKLLRIPAALGLLCSLVLPAFGRPSQILNEIDLVATPNGPAGAKGEVQFLPNGAGYGADYQFTQLPVGEYTLNATFIGGSSIPVAIASFSIEGYEDVNQPEFQGFSALPDGVDPRALASLQVNDPNGVPLLLGSIWEKPEHHEDFRLIPTSNAPQSAKGEAKVLGAEAIPSLQVKTEGLNPGTYTVAVTGITSGSSFVMGAFEIVLPGAPVPALETENDTETDVTLPFPVGFDPTDVGSVQVLNAQELLVLSGDGKERGGLINGNSRIQQKAKLLPSAAAPAEATGRLEIQALNNRGVNFAFLKIETKGLASGTYGIISTSLASNLPVFLGNLFVDEAGEDAKVLFGGRKGLSFPADFNPLDIAKLEITDPLGTVLLTGDLLDRSRITSSSLRSLVKLTPLAPAPLSKGTATLSARIVRLELRQQFTLIAKGLPADTLLIIKVNGIPAGEVTTTSKGQLIVKKMPLGIDAHQVTSVTAEKDGQVLLRADF